MKTLKLWLIGSALLLGTVACGSSRTSADAPLDVGGKVDTPQQVEATKEDANNPIRQEQLNSDIRAREERNQWFGDQLKRADADLESEVRAKLEANIPRSQLVVEANEGTVSISGTVPDQKEYSSIEPLAKEIKGVKAVKVDVRVVAPNN